MLAKNYSKTFEVFRSCYSPALRSPCPSFQCFHLCALPHEVLTGTACPSFHCWGYDPMGAMSCAVQGEVHPRTRTETRLSDQALLHVPHLVSNLPHHPASSSTPSSVPHLLHSRLPTLTPACGPYSSLSTREGTCSFSTISGLPSPPRSTFSFGLPLCLLS